MTDEQLAEGLRLLRESFLRSAPCQPRRTQEDVDFVLRTLRHLARERPDRRSRIEAELAALRRECAVEGLHLPQPARV